VDKRGKLAHVNTSVRPSADLSTALDQQHPCWPAPCNYSDYRVTDAD